ncbi:ABC transporter ATP-binding protein [Catelliglobosispora koreensis]|uniref:ABC transporter ATP-binding protein n=1 Tax=Catelliglobosispora koreensis TaxID=129052 RepID=UPI00036E21E4|nr:ABC transporter ATP-binding protein [Catelliglobosispora koreensis]
MHPDLVIAAEQVNVIRSGKMLLQGITWQVELDERWVILGPNGAGKTTLLSLAAARTHPTSGTVHVLGEKIGRTDMQELRTRVGFSTSALAERIPGTEKVRDVVLTASWSVVGRFREAYDQLDTSRADRLLSDWGMGSLADREYGTLSEGERKRTQIARALMVDPELLLLDEPAAGLDLGGREDLVGRLSDLALDPDAPAMVLVTHHVEEIPPGFTHGMLLREGAIVSAGPLPQVMTSDNLSATFGVKLRVSYEEGRYAAVSAR